MSATVYPVTLPANGGPAVQPARSGAFLSGLARSAALLPISTTSPYDLAWLPEQPRSTTWVDERSL